MIESKWPAAARFIAGLTNSRFAVQILFFGFVSYPFMPKMRSKVGALSQAESIGCVVPKALPGPRVGMTGLTGDGGGLCFDLI